MLTKNLTLSAKVFLHIGVGLLLISNHLLGTPSATATVSSSASPARYGTGFINESNTITITITHTGTDANSSASGGYNGGDVRLYYVFSETDTEPDIDTDCTGSSGAQDNCARYWSGKVVTVAGNDSEITITATELDNKDPVSGHEGNHFDFKIRCTPLVKGCDDNVNGHTTEALCIAGATDHDDNAANHWRAGYPDQVYIDVDTWGDAGNNPYLSYDIVDPYFGPAGTPTAPTGSFFLDDGYFNDDITITIQTGEALSGTYDSYIVLTGDNNSPFDSGNEHYYFLTANYFGSGDIDVTIAADAWKNSTNTQEFPLVDGAIYDIKYYLHDEAGNKSDGTDVTHNETYDVSHPTITSISDFELDIGPNVAETGSVLPSDGTENWVSLVSGDIIGGGSDTRVPKLRYRINFSEKVNADGPTTVTYNTTATSSVSESDIDGISTNSPYRVRVYYNINRTNDSGADPLSISAISSGGGWKDRAGNEIVASNNAYPITGAALEDNASVTIDLGAPQIDEITTTPLSGDYGLGAVIPLTVVFNETVDLGGAITITLDAPGNGTVETISAQDDMSQAIINYTVGESDASSQLSVSSVNIDGNDFSLLKDDATYYKNEASSVNPATNLQANANLVIETTRPIIGEISTTYTNGTYGVDAEIPIKVKFYNGTVIAGNESVTLSGGDITITLNSEGTATISSISATNEAVGTYTVGTGDTEVTLAGASIAATGTIVDGFGNELSSPITLPTNNFPTNDELIIDVTKPALDNVSAQLNDAVIPINDPVTETLVKISDEITFTLNFIVDNSSPSVTDATRLSGNATLNLNTDSQITLVAYSDDAAPTVTYTVQENDETPTNNYLDITSYELNGNYLTDNPDYAYDSDNSPNQIATPISPGTAFTTNYKIIVDGVYPYISSATSTTNNGIYGIGKSVSITINFNETVTSTAALQIPVSGLGSTIELATISPAADNQIGTYTIVEDDNVALLDVTSAATTSGTISDGAGNLLQTVGLTVPANSNITDDDKEIVIDGVRPGAPLSVTLAPYGGSADLTNASDYAAFFNSTNTHLKVTVQFTSVATPDGSMENGYIYLQANIGGNGWSTLWPDDVVLVASDDVAPAFIAAYQITAADWASATKTAEILISTSSVADVRGVSLSGSTLAHDDEATSTAGQLDGETIDVRVKLVDNAKNTAGSGWVAGTYTSATSALEIDTQLPDLDAISYVSTTARAQPYPLATDIDLRLTFDDEVTLIGNGQIIISLNVGNPTISTVEFEYIAGAAGQFGELTEASLTGDATYTVGATDYTSDDLEVDAISLSSDGLLRDQAGNSISIAELTLDLAAGTNLSGVKVDGVIPIAPNTFAIDADPDPTYTISTADCNCADFWNQDTDDAEFTISIPLADASMENGKVHIVARTGSNNYEVVGSSAVLTSAQANNAGTITITVLEAVFDATNWWPNELSTPEVGDVDFKIRAEDYAGNTTDTDNAQKKIIHVDEIDPLPGTIIELKPYVVFSNGNSIAQDGYWNIDTDKLKVTLDDLSSADDNIVPGQVQLYGNINNIGYTELGSIASITDGNKASFYIEVGEWDDWDDTDQAQATASDIITGIKDLPGAASWDDMDGNDFAIKAVVIDEAGNSVEWTINSTIRVAGLTAADRPKIEDVTSDNDNGWYGPQSQDLPIEIELNPDVEITVVTTDGTPSIKLETGTNVGVATYSSGSTTRELNFDYTPGIGEESSDLAFKLTSGNAIIDLNGGLMYSVGGNLLQGGNNNATSSSPELPKPGDANDGKTSLDEDKDFIIDGVAPENVNLNLYTNTASSDVQVANDAFADGSHSYYNSAVDEIRFQIGLGYGPDESLMVQNWAVDDSDCNSANGCGKIQIKAFMVAENAETPDLVNYHAVAIDYDDLHSQDTQVNPYPYQYIYIDAGPPENCGGCSFETDFVDDLGTTSFAEGNVMVFEVDIIDLAGNITTTSSDNFIIDRIPPTQGTISTIETEALDHNGISSTTSMNNVAGYWNRHNTGLRLTVPLDDDLSLVNGDIYIIGRKVGVDNWQVLGDYGEAIYDISANEVNTQTIVPSSSDLLEDIETTENGNTWPDGVEEMNDFEEGVSLEFSARVYDVARNYTDFTFDYTPLFVDTTSPEIQNVNSLNTAKAYGAGETIYISVKTNEQMRAVGAGASNSTLELATGETADSNPIIPFRSVSNDTVYYTYTTQAGESSEDDNTTLVTTADRLKYVATTSLLITEGEGVLTDLAGNNLGKFLTPGEDFWPYLPDLDNASSLDQMTNIIIDTDPPGVTFTYFEGTTSTPSDSLVSVNNTDLIIRATFTDSIRYNPGISDYDPTLDITWPPHLRTGDRENLTNLRMVRTGKWQYDYSLPLIDSVHSINGLSDPSDKTDNLIISPTAFDKANNPIYLYPGVPSTVNDSDIVRMDNEEPKFIWDNLITALQPDSNSYVNNAQTAYDLNEDLFSGSIIWEWVSGTSDNSADTITLGGNELLSGEVSQNHVLHDVTDTPELVDGANYKVIWSATDSAGNQSVEELFISRPVHYDTTKPSAYLDYKLDVVGEEYVDTVWVTFSEPMDTVTNARYTIDFLDNPSQASNAEGDLTIIDSTRWVFWFETPDIGGTSCSTIVEITATDRAGNELDPSAVFHVTGFNNSDTLSSDILRVDNTPPICTLSYINTRDSLLTDDPGDYAPNLAHGKSGDNILIIAKLDDEFGKPPEFNNPTINVHFSYLEITDTDYYSFDSSSSDADLISIYQTSDPDFIDDSTFVWNLIIPDSVHGRITITINGTDRANNPIDGYDGFELVVDNKFPDSLATGTVAGWGTPMPPPRWLNGITDSIGIMVPIPSADPSLLSSPNGNVHFEITNLKSNPNLSVPIPRLRTMIADSITNPDDEGIEFFRTFAEIEAGIANMIPPQSLLHRDSIAIQAAVSDRVGNKTKYTTSTTILHYDPFMPVVSDINGGNVYNDGEEPLPLISSDTLSAAWSASYDINADGEDGSGISGYDYMIYEHDSVGNYIDTLLSWISNGRSEEVFVTDLGLVHKRGYSFSVRAVDTAGNVSDTVASEIIYRSNTPPLISIDSLISAFEDFEYKVPIEITDPDTATNLYDRFYYHGYGKNGLGWFQWYPPRNDDSLYFHELGNDPVIDNAGFITWTPTAWDTGDHQIRLMVKDSAELWDTLDYTMTVLPINDPPFFRSGTDFDYTYTIAPYNEYALQMPDITIDEDQAESLRVDMTQYIYDEDNDDTTGIAWSGVWIEETPGSGYHYPLTSLFFGPGTPEIFKERLRAQYLPQHNTELSEHKFQSELKTVGNRTTNTSITEKSIVFHNTPDGDYAMIKGSPDYYGQNDTIYFIAIDTLTRLASSLFDTIGSDRDTVLITVNAVNDKPFWSDTSKFGIDTAPVLTDTITMLENDTLPLSLYSYARDIDNLWLNFTLQVTTYDSDNDVTTVDRMKTDPKENVVKLSYGDSTDLVKFIPDLSWTEVAKIRVTAADSAQLDSSKEFYINVLRVPRPSIVVDIIKNNVLDTYFDILITDTLGKTEEMIMNFNNDVDLPLFQVDSFTYLYRYKAQIDDQQTQKYVRVWAYSWIGSVYNEHEDITPFTLRYVYETEPWELASPGGLFRVAAEAGAVNMDQFILLVDSTMFKKGYSGSYKLGDEVRVFNKPVEVSMASYDDDLALYQRNTDKTWAELPSYNKQGRILAYTDRMGYFRLGRKTIMVPGLTSLGQNYPNPFNPVTNITYDIGFVDGPDQHVNLSIYNLLGQHVQTLVNAKRSMGRHNVKWYGKDKSGISIASGIYFVHMTTSAGKVQTKKVMLLR